MFGSWFKTQKIGLIWAIIVSSVISSAIVFVVCLIVARPIMSKYIQEQVRSHQSTVKAYAKESISQQLLMGDAPEILRKCHFLLQDEDLLSIYMRDLSGEVVCNLRKSRNGSDSFRAVEVPIFFDQPETKIATTMILEFSTKKEAHLTFVMTLTTLLGAALLFSVQILFTIPLVRRVIRPLAELSNAVASKNPQDVSLPAIDHHRPLISEVDHIYGALRSFIDQFRMYREKLIESTRFEAIVHTSQAIAHDLRAPLGVFERLLLLEDGDIGKQRLAIRDSLNRLYSMIDSFRYADLESMVVRTHSQFGFNFGAEVLDAKADQHAIRLVVPDVVHVGLNIDAPKVERAWINLASNATEFAKSFVHVESEVRKSDFFIRVIDDGPGVPDAFLPRLFQRGATHGKHDGTGLGLAYVRQIMRGHGGDVTYRRENGFTIFECRLPNAIVENQEDEMVRTSAATTKEMAPAKRVGICFVPRSMAESLCAELSSLKSEKFSFSIEYDGSDFVATNDPDLALTATEEGKQPLEFKAKLAEAVILEGLKRRFDLV